MGSAVTSMFAAATAVLSLSSQLATSTNMRIQKDAPQDLVKAKFLETNMGQTYAWTLHSKIFNSDRKIRIFVPKSYESNRRPYPVILASDAAYYLPTIATISQQLSSFGQIPECIVLGIEHTNRESDLTPPGLGRMLAQGEENGEKLAQFIQNELVPECKRRLRICEPYVFLGHSHGGLFANYLLSDHSKFFFGIISLDSPTHHKGSWITKRILESKTIHPEIRYFSGQAVYGWLPTNWNAIATTRPELKHIVTKTYPAETHQSMLFVGTYDGLQFVFRDYSSINVKGWTPLEAFEYYQKLEIPYRDPVTPPRSVIINALNTYQVYGMKNEALAALALLSNTYSPPENVEDLRVNIEKASQQMTGKLNAKQMLSLPKPSQQELGDFVGKWRGTSQTGESDPALVTLSLNFNNGKFEGSWVMDLGEVQLNMPITYCQVQGDKIEFGYLNGMHPRGIITYCLSRKGNRLSGFMQMKGVYFEYPPGVRPPPVSVNIERDP